MHLILEETGHIRSAGPTLQKMNLDVDLVGQRFLEVFQVRRPRAITSVSELQARAGTKLHLQLRNGPAPDLKGVLIAGLEKGQMIVNLSFGISILDAVRQYSLTAADFAATDLAIEMLYLVEAKSAAMDASHQLTQRLQGARIAAEEQAFTDTLTGLKNRRALFHILSRLVEEKANFAVMQIDLDYFKQVNDTMGHAAGDHVLQAVSKILVEETRHSDTVARIGGDEFVAVVLDAQDRAILERIGKRIIERLEEPIPFDGQQCRISASIGTSTFSGDPHRDVDQLLDDADLALYASKQAGRARQTFFAPKLRKSSALTPPVDQGQTVRGVH